MAKQRFYFWLNNAAKRFTGWLLLVFSFLNIALFYMTGAASVLLTLSLLLLIFLAGSMVINKVAPTDLRSRLMTTFTATLITLLFGELLLRYVIKYHQSYNERKGNFFYSSPYERCSIDNIIWRQFVEKNIYWRIAQQPNICYEIKSSNEFSYLHCYNELGLRGKLPDSTESDLLIGLGDSFTEGFGVSDDSTWVALVAKFRQMAFLNAGVIGSDPVMELEVLKELLKKYKPTEVILAIHSNDLGDIAMRGGISRYDAQGNIRSRPAPWFEILYAASFICRSMVHDVFHLNYYLMSEKQWWQELKIAEDTLLKIIEDGYVPLAHKNGFRFTVVIFPILYELDQPDFALNNLHQKLSALYGVKVFNLYSCYRKNAETGRLNISELYWKNDGHYTPLGYALMAKCIADSLP